MMKKNNLPRTLIFLGPQGSGKGTQAELLAKGFGYRNYSTGDMLRKIAEEDSELGRKVKSTIDAGHLVGPELVSAAVADLLMKLPPKDPVIIDGYPRSLEQLRLMKELLPKAGRNEYAVLYFDITEAETFKRLGLREKKEGRADDNESSIRKRLEYFRNETMPMITLMEKEGKFIRVNGMPSIARIHQDVIQKLNL